MISTAFIKLWGIVVGAVAWDSSKEIASFEYTPEFINSGLDISPIKMPLLPTIYSFSELRRSNTFKGLPGLLADILPDKYGNTLINVWLSKQGRPSDSLNPVELLCFIGERGMGGLEIEPATIKSKEEAQNIELDGLIDIAKKILSGREDFNTNLKSDEEKALLDILKIGTSAGGARAKAVIAYNESTGEIRSGQTKAPEGFSHWLIKFDGVFDNQFGVSGGYGRVEIAYYYMALDVGIEMMPSRLLEENGRAHFMTQRFDRLGNDEKLHVQTFCALRHFDYNEVNLYSYEQLFETMRILRLPYTDAEQLFCRMVFNVVARNCDDHTKNFSFIMDKQGKWRLSPAYDVCHAYRPNSTWVSQHALSINGKRKDIDREDFIEVANKMNIKQPHRIIDRIIEVVNNWENYALKVSVPEDIIKSIKQTFDF
ncbi:type II toxin-antitoxin system HipA family toxin [Flavobacterium litorale]|uniref:Type II toxin-antitoxin system HipA family toxin n=1 Tax=Flavobacterium litorale TaxID=2856519 RepID=A0ABX8VD10_9FLAO|nr:type II toxin-antitoxin system HipA family toxin [Flavobacterium litorale]QYJ68931.1 type II toxin-antitoxin system HipA family toxin [Flavobacterium litorale]